MLTVDECKRHLNNTDLSDQDIEKVRDLLHAFVERTLDYVVENGMLVGTKSIWQANENNMNQEQS